MDASPPRSDAGWVAALVALDPVGLGGAVVRASAGAHRDAWWARVVAMAPAARPVRRVPLHVDDERLLGGLDLAATLQTGRVVTERGLLASADGGVLLIAMAERMAPATAAHIAAAMDAGIAGRDGGSVHFGAVALDEGLADDEAAPARLAERLAFRVELDAAGSADESDPTRADIAAAAGRLPRVAAGDDIVEALCAASLALGADSIRAPLFALRTARAIAALDGRTAVDTADAALAARLVLAHRAMRLPLSEAPAESAPDDPPGPPEPPAESPAEPPAEPAVEPPAEPPAGASESPPDDAAAASQSAAEPPSETVLEAAVAALPPHLLEALRALPAGVARKAVSGRAGATLKNATRGRPVGARRGLPRGGARLALLETLRAAAPWQALRRREVGAGPGPTIHVRREDFHVRRHVQRRETTTLFVVDASGSSALHRLAEAKGAVELLLAECYVRRDSVALIAFRGRGAEVLLPPTRSLARAKRSLAGLPGGGGTPLAAGIDAAVQLVETVRRRGATPFVVLLTDGRGNVARDGSPGREPALRDALASAGRLRATGAATLLMDTSPQPQDVARRVAAALGARYLPLPHAAARDLSRAVLAASVATA